jgi:Major Facilitator Superfamily
MFETIAARMRHSDVNYRLLVPLLASSAAVQAVTAIVRITTSYRILELGLPVVWLGIVSATYAVLPVFIAVWLGRFIDRGHDALATWIGSALMVAACAGLWASGTSTASLLLSNALLGVGQLFTVISQQMLCVRCSRLRSRESVFGNYMVAGAVGQGLGPLIVGWSGGDATVPPTQFLFAAGFFASVLALACAVPIREPPARQAAGWQGGHAGAPPAADARARCGDGRQRDHRDRGRPYRHLSSPARRRAQHRRERHRRSVDHAGGGVDAGAPHLCQADGRLRPRRADGRESSAGRRGVRRARHPDADRRALCRDLDDRLQHRHRHHDHRVTSVVALTAAGARGTANSLRVTGNRIAQAAMPFGASLVAAVTGAGGIFVIIAISLLASSAAVYWSRPQK